MKNSRQRLNSENLKQKLWETLMAVSGKTCSPGQANSIAAQSREIMRIVNAEIKIAQLRGEKPTKMLEIGVNDQSGREGAEYRA